MKSAERARSIQAITLNDDKIADRCFSRNVASGVDIACVSPQRCPAGCAGIFNTAHTRQKEYLTRRAYSSIFIRRRLHSYISRNVTITNTVPSTLSGNRDGTEYLTSRFSKLSFGHSSHSSRFYFPFITNFFWRASEMGSST